MKIKSAYSGIDPKQAIDLGFQTSIRGHHLGRKKERNKTEGKGRKERGLRQKGKG